MNMYINYNEDVNIINISITYDKVSANTASSVPKPSKFQSGHRVVTRANLSKKVSEIEP